MGSQPCNDTVSLHYPAQHPTEFGYVSPCMAYLHSESLFDCLVPQTILLPPQEQLSFFPSVGFGSSHCEAIQAVKSLLIPLAQSCSEWTDSQGSSCRRWKPLHKKEMFNLSSWDWCTTSVLLLNSHMSWRDPPSCSCSRRWEGSTAWLCGMQSSWPPTCWLSGGSW